jgi:uncharacterized membrane protein YphA (DoxX/SURF4 family)
MRWLLLLLRFVLGGLFILAGFLKLQDPSKFALEISNYQMISTGSTAMAALLPAIEIVAGAALLVLPQAWRRSAALLILLMVVMFSVAVSTAYFRGINIDCGCFGGAASPITWLTLVRNLGLLLASLFCVVFDRPAPRAFTASPSPFRA